MTGCTIGKRLEGWRVYNLVERKHVEPTEAFEVSFATCPNMEFVLHTDLSGRYCWVVAERFSGFKVCGVWDGKDEALKAAANTLKLHGEAKTRAAVQKVGLANPEQMALQPHHGVRA